MPFARTDMIKAKSAEFRRGVGAVVHQAMIDVLKAPSGDCFQATARRLLFIRKLQTR